MPQHDLNFRYPKGSRALTFGPQVAEHALHFEQLRGEGNDLYFGGAPEPEPPAPPRWIVATAAVAVADAGDVAVGRELHLAHPAPIPGTADLRTVDSPRVDGRALLRVGAAAARQDARTLRLADGRLQQQQADLRTAHLAARAAGDRLAVRDGRAITQLTVARWRHPPLRALAPALRLGDGRHRSRSQRLLANPAPGRRGLWTLVLGDGGHPVWRWPVPTVEAPPPVEPPVEPDRSSLDLHFACLIPLPGGEHLLRFGAPVCIAPIRAVYLVSNVVTAARMPGGEPIGLSRITLRTDRQAWGWRFDAQVADPASAALLRATGTGPHPLLVTINGYAWDLVVERLADTRQFPGRGWTIEGRSTLAALAAPHAPVSTAVELQQRTAQQLVANVLDPWGWAVDWRATDWLVPGGVLAYADASPVAAVRQVVAAFEGTMRQARTGQSLIVHNRYQVDPWDWGQAQVDQTITAPILEESQAERPGPGYNGVYVAGERFGVVARVRRDGTNGTPFAPLASDPLLTEAAANRQRGKAILGAARPKRDVTLNLPVLEAPLQPRLAEIGELVEVDDGQEIWRAQVEAITLTVQRRNGAVSVRQSVQLERDDG